MLGMKINPERERLYRDAGQWTDTTLLDRWEQTLAAFAEKEFVCDDQGGRYTYRQMDQFSGQIASVLAQLGVAAGEIVTFQITPRSEFVAVTLACLKLGAVPAPLGMCFERQELHQLLSLLQSRVHLCMSVYRGSPRGALLVESCSDLPFLRQMVLLGSDPEASGLPCLETLLQGRLPEPPRHHGKGGDLAAILCTSGTTQGCKAVMFTHNNIIYSEDVFNRELGLGPQDAIFMPAPLSHATGFHHGIISPMLCGGRLVLQERFCCQSAVEQMNREKCTYSMGATPFIYDLLARLDETGERLPYLRFYICGGAPVPEKLVCRAYDRHQILVCECYGSTESVPHLFVRPEEALSVKGRWSGRAMEGVEVRIVDAEHHTLPYGEIGEEASRGPNVFVGYWRDSKITGQALDDDGWYYSGDLCKMDKEGHVKVVGRKKDVIIRGGENLNVNELDANLDGCPGIADHAVVGMPDPRLGERICAFIVDSPDVPPITKEDVIAYLKQNHIHKRHWPERLEHIDAIPRTESGKVKKHLLTAEIARRMAQEQEGSDYGTEDQP